MEEAAQSRWIKGREIIRRIQGGISDLIFNDVILNLYWTSTTTATTTTNILVLTEQ